MGKQKLAATEVKALLQTLQQRFENNMHRHPGFDWKTIENRLERSPGKMWSLAEMERTGGEPDVIALGKTGQEIIFVDCVAESPKGRRSLCYDADALAARKEHKPKDSALNMAAQMGIELLDEAQYRALQQLGNFDMKTSSWILTPAAIRKEGGALFCDRRYNHVFTYHNGAESYYAARGFRAILKV